MPILKLGQEELHSQNFPNAGQMCVAPDYVLVHASVKDKLVAELKTWIENFIRPILPLRIIMERSSTKGSLIDLVKYLEREIFFYGGQFNASQLYIAPTLMGDITSDAPVMSDEIFGPISPIISFDNKDQALY